MRSALDKSDGTGDYEYDPTGVILEPAHFTKVHTGNPDILNYFEHLFVTFCIFFFPSFFFFLIIGIPHPKLINPKKGMSFYFIFLNYRNSTFKINKSQKEDKCHFI